MKILVINGPNLNMLGMRDIGIYGVVSLDVINERLRRIAEGFHNCFIDFFQSNCEGEIISKIQKAYSDGTSGILINAAAYTHTSIGILDALTILGKAKPFPYVEVHLSNPKAREKFRHYSFLEANAIATVSGKQAESYYEGIQILLAYLEGN
jgi:3-dehydroquinate dehydratase-2